MYGPDNHLRWTGLHETQAIDKFSYGLSDRGASIRMPVNIEADSINAALLAPESSPGSAAFDAFLREVVREMTVKAGQKCTAIRRIFVPVGKADAVADALAEKLLRELSEQYPGNALFASEYAKATGLPAPVVR